MTDKIVKREVELEDRKLSILGVKHADAESAQAAANQIMDQEPDWVGVELDENRKRQLRGEDFNIQISKAFKQGKGGLVAMQSLLSIYQNKLSDSEIKPGQEMIQALDRAEAAGAETGLIDQDINKTFKHVMNIPLSEKLRILKDTVLGSSKEHSSFKDMVDNLDTALAKYPELKKEVLDRRNIHMARKIREAEFSKGAVVVGAGHAKGIAEALASGEQRSMPPPEGSRINLSKAASKGIPVFIISTFLASFYISGADKIVDASIAWIAANSILAGAGALLSRSHPVTVGVSAISSPLASMNPMIGTGMVAGYTEAKINKPQISDIDSLSKIQRYRDLWNNKAGIVILTFIFTTLGSLLGSVIGSALVVSTAL